MANATLSEFADKMGEIMPVIGREFMKAQMQDFHKTKITMPQIVVLDILNRRGESRMTDLANYLHVTTAAMTGIIDRIVRDSYVTRENDPEDRRIVKIKLTAKGEKITKDITEKRKKLTMKIFSMISQKERDQYIRILTHIKNHLLERAH